MPLGIDSVVGTEIYRGETPHMPLGIKQYLQVPTSTIPEEGNAISHRHLIFYSDINNIVGAYHYLVPVGMGNKAQ